ncbi:hypothetical protein BSKO_08746 [Bryopsis sp. KO-2023]|nr:hypothetical protein BSKO_08746 [Bryopsis sp. KO-2023]
MEGMDLEGPSGTCAFDEEFSGGVATDFQRQKKPRLTAQWADKGQRFVVTDKGSDHQFAQTYFCRLNQLAPSTASAAQKKWPDAQVVKILDVKEKKEAVVIGTLFKEMKLKPSVLDEYTSERGVKSDLGRVSLCSEDDTMALEDGNARMALTGNGLVIEKLVTGVVLAVRGAQQKNGCFNVTDVCFPGSGPQPSIHPQEDKYIAFVSGLGVGSNQPPLALELLGEFLSGSVGNDTDREMVQKIVRVVVAGGTLNSMDALGIAAPNSRHQSRALEPLKDASMYLVELASSAPVDVMPGNGDPATFALPQQPMNRRLFGGGGQYANVTMMTNPCEFEADGVRLMGTSGQNIQDIERYSTYTDRLKMLECCLEWRHLAPTAPDTLMCFPLNDEDPFVISETPHVLFAGDQPKFETKYVQVYGEQCVRLLCIPKFSTTGQIILLNLKNLKCHPVTLDLSSLQ